MESLNRIELVGRVSAVRIQNLNDTHVVRFTVQTKIEYADHGGNRVETVTWHTVVLVTQQETPKIAQGDVVEVTGYLRSVRYTRQDGSETSTVEVYAQRVAVYHNVNSLDAQKA